MSSRFSVASRLRSFEHALRGLREIVRFQHNAWIHLAGTVGAIGAGLLLQIDRGDWLAIVLVVGSTGLILVSHFMTEKPWDVSYDPSALIAKYHDVREGGAVPTVTEVVENPNAKTFVGVDDAFLAGGTSQICYQALFGYKLQKYPIGKLHEGSVFAESGGFLNMKNPACYLFPDENNCKPGDHFRVEQSDELAAFVTNQGFEWQAPAVLRIANWVNLLALAVTMLLIVLAGLRTIIPKKPGS